jgi:hypothetical protein
MSNEIRTRIVGHGEEKPEQLLAHPQNFRRHPGHQLEALRGSMRELGWVKTVLVNKRTGHVVDGHARVEEALRQGLATVPVTYIDLSAEEERLALAVLDPITELAVRDDEILAGLLAEVTTEDEGLKLMLEDMREELDPSPAPPAPSAAEGATLIVKCGSSDERDALAKRLKGEGFSVYCAGQEAE